MEKCKARNPVRALRVRAIQKNIGTEVLFRGVHHHVANGMKTLYSCSLALGMVGGGGNPARLATANHSRGAARQCLYLLAGALDIDAERVSQSASSLTAPEPLLYADYQTICRGSQTP